MLVAVILGGMNLDCLTVACGLLHDVVDDTDVTLDDIEDEFGPEVRHIVVGVTKIG
ncbi:HD domain-containing protein, partial [Streptococcus suis]